MLTDRSIRFTSIQRDCFERMISQIVLIYFLALAHCRSFNQECPRDARRSFWCGNPSYRCSLYGHSLYRLSVRQIYSIIKCHIDVARALLYTNVHFSDRRKCTCDRDMWLSGSTPKCIGWAARVSWFDLMSRFHAILFWWALSRNKSITQFYTKKNS